MYMYVHLLEIKYQSINQNFLVSRRRFRHIPAITTIDQNEDYQNSSTDHFELILLSNLWTKTPFLIQGLIDTVECSRFQKYSRVVTPSGRQLKTAKGRLTSR